MSVLDIFAWLVLIVLLATGGRVAPSRRLVPWPRLRAIAIGQARSSGTAIARRPVNPF